MRKAAQCKYLAVLLSVGWSLTCAASGPSSKSCASDIASLQSVLAVPPVQAAKQAGASGDLRYFEVFGYTSELPSVASPQCARDENATKPLEGTTDAVCNKEHRKLVERSKSYAAAYNNQMHLERKTRGVKSCGAA